jgi:hypothetical protein
VATPATTTTATARRPVNDDVLTFPSSRQVLAPAASLRRREGRRG